jgi:hypothetical protein
MARFASAAGFAMGSVVASLISHDGSRVGLQRPRQTGGTCSVEALGRAAAVDTTHLHRVKRESAPSKSAEGGATTGPRQRTGDCGDQK